MGTAALRQFYAFGHVRRRRVGHRLSLFPVCSENFVAPFPLLTPLSSRRSSARFLRLPVSLGGIPALDCHRTHDWWFSAVRAQDLGCTTPLDLRGLPRSPLLLLSPLLRLILLAPRLQYSADISQKALLQGYMRQISSASSICTLLSHSVETKEAERTDEFDRFSCPVPKPLILAPCPLLLQIGVQGPSQGSPDLVQRRYESCCSPFHRSSGGSAEHMIALNMFMSRCQILWHKKSTCVFGSIKLLCFAQGL